MKKRTDKPEAIILSIGVKFLKEYGEAQFHRAMELLDQGAYETWNMVCKNLPTIPVEFCYFTVGGKIMYRLSVYELERNVSKSFSDSEDRKEREFENKNWVVLCGPVVKATGDFPQRGFQGFRYSPFLF